MARLTKQAILEGTKIRSTLTVKEYGGAEVIIRPITDGELSQILSVIGNIPLNKDGTPDFSKVDIQKRRNNLKRSPYET